MGGPALLVPAAVRLGVVVADRDAAIEATGALLVSLGAVPDDYVRSMHDREAVMTTNLGRGWALPHGAAGSQDLVRHDALCVLVLAAPLAWAGGQDVDVVVGLAARTDAHAPALARVASVVLDADASAAVRGATDAATVVRLLAPPPFTT